MRLTCTALEIPSAVTVYHTGPPLDQGPLPSIFYFALSGPDSLTLDPYNQPVQFLQDLPIRFFSLTLPAHEESLSPHNALTIWAEEMAKGVDLLHPFFDAVERAVEYVVQQKLADPHKLGVAGLSRGGFIASHVAVRDKRFRHILQFAPVTRLDKAKEFHALRGNPILHTLDLVPLAPRIADRNIRLYIGNNDTRVDTRSCFEFMMHLVQHAPTKFPPISLFINPSIGQYGHGTPPEIFREGAHWLARCLED